MVETQKVFSSMFFTAPGYKPFHWCEQMLIVLLIASLAPVVLPMLTAALNELRIDPQLTPEEEKLVEAVAKSEWARALAAKMATTPEAQEKVARLLATSLVKGTRGL
jgi:hypothetical protein